MPHRNPFKGEKPSAEGARAFFRGEQPTYPDRREKALADAKQAIELAFARARKCIEHKDFKAYADQIDKAQEVTLQTMMAYENPDPVQYAFVIRDMILGIKHARALLTGISSDMKKRPDQAESKGETS